MTTQEVEPSGCPFCAIVKRHAPAREVFRTDRVLAFLPDVPAVLGHTLVIPREHIRDIWGLDRPTGHVLADATRRVASAVSTATGAEGMNIIQSNGAVAGQSVFHLHIHVVPRHLGDRMPNLWPIDADWSGWELDSVADALRAAVDRYTFE
jgi:histidine triad (HIT) family protein